MPKALAGPSYPFGDLSDRVSHARQRREIPGRKLLKYQVRAHSSDPNSIPLPREVIQALGVRSRRDEMKGVHSGRSNRLVLGLARDPMQHFLQKRLSSLPETRLAFKHEVDFVSQLISKVNPKTVLAKIKRPLAARILYPRQEDYALKLAEYMDLLCQNQAPDEHAVAKLTTADKQENTTNQGVGIGSFCERRLGLALARLMDYGYIRKFTLFGAAKDPVIASNDKSYSTYIDYNKGEEAMGIDAMVELNAKQPYTYALLQAKASGQMGFKADKAKGSFSQLSLNKQELSELIRLRPEVAEFYKCVPGVNSSFYVIVERNIFTIDLAKRKIQKTCYGDYAPDIVNFLLAAFEYMQDKYDKYYSEINLKRRAYLRSKGKYVEPEKPSLLILDRPYESLSYPEKIAALLKSHFFKLAKEKPQT